MELTTRPNDTQGVQTTKEPLKGTELHGANLCVLELPLFILPRLRGANF